MLALLWPIDTLVNISLYDIVERQPLAITGQQQHSTNNDDDGGNGGFAGLIHLCCLCCFLPCALNSKL